MKGILKTGVVALLVMLVFLPVMACIPQPVPPPPPPPPPPPGGVVTVSPPKIPYATLEKMWPKVARALKFPEALIPKLPAAIAIMPMPIKFSGSGWPPGEMVTIELILPPNVKIPGVEPGEPVGIATATADAAGKFTATVGSIAKINFLLRGAWTDIASPDWTKVNPLPNGVYIIRAVGIDPGTVDRTIIELELWPPK